MIRAVLAVVLSLPAIQFAQGQPQQAEEQPQQQQQEQEQKGPVRATEPTVVTIEGTADRVKTDKGRKKRSLGSKAAGGLKTGAAKTWNGIVSFGGWLLNTGDDIPSDRERQREAEAAAKRKFSNAVN